VQIDCLHIAVEVEVADAGIRHKRVVELAEVAAGTAAHELDLQPFDTDFVAGADLAGYYQGDTAGLGSQLRWDTVHPLRQSGHRRFDTALDREEERRLSSAADPGNVSQQARCR
jgi:hypothetical protein